jgi:hypothetical protein
MDEVSGIHILVGVVLIVLGQESVVNSVDKHRLKNGRKVLNRHLLAVLHVNWVLRELLVDIFLSKVAFDVDFEVCNGLGVLLDEVLEVLLGNLALTTSVHLGEEEVKLVEGGNFWT